MTARVQAALLLFAVACTGTKDPGATPDTDVAPTVLTPQPIAFHRFVFVGDTVPHPPMGEVISVETLAGTAPLTHDAEAGTITCTTTGIACIRARYRELEPKLADVQTGCVICVDEWGTARTSRP